ncbi:SRPBCC family protein [Litoribacter populi]|uniref:SRPBCC family protein n=1 Tax=Litoribacter populi TaxID=2598460 RepID=UPI00117C86C8|nr:SRPBCC family protein [Litoribacter populi]
MEKLALISISVEVNAPLSQVWRSWTSPQHIVNWNYASDTWHCPNAVLDLTPGGKFNYRMAAKDESDGFDFKGTFDEVIENERIAFTLDDGRKVIVSFQQKDDYVLVQEDFEAEQTHSLELQKNGWQAILENFKSYTEQLSKMVRMEFEMDINAPVERVYDTMLSPDTYREWTTAFFPGSFYRGKWEEGEKIYFIGPSQDGCESGMVARVEKAVPNKIASVKHMGLLDKGKEITDGPEVMGWKGALEEYRFEEIAGGTKLQVSADTNLEHREYFAETWPKALELLKSICETNK